MEDRKNGQKCLWSKYTTVQSHGSHDMNFPNIIGEQVVDKIVERVVDKINKEVKPDCWEAPLQKNGCR